MIERLSHSIKKSVVCIKLLTAISKIEGTLVKTKHSYSYIKKYDSKHSECCNSSLYKLQPAITLNGYAGTQLIKYPYSYTNRKRIFF